MVTLRCSAVLPAPPVELPSIGERPQGSVLEILDGCVQRETLFCGDRVAGPVTILEAYTTTRVPAGWFVEVDRVGNLRGSREGAGNA